jgi:hypothetical protein
MEAVERSSVPLRAALNERMSHAAQAIVAEVDASRGGGEDERARVDRIDATAREVFRVLMEQPIAARIDTAALSQAYGQAAYACAEKLEEARAAWLAKRGQR